MVGDFYTQGHRFAHPCLLSLAKRLKRKIKTKKIAVLDDATKSTEVIEAPMEIGEEVLIAEIGGGPRWKQVNFPIAIFEDFFGAESR
mgnify:CR=1 FL=1